MIWHYLDVLLIAGIKLRIVISVSHSILVARYHLYTNHSPLKANPGLDLEDAVLPSLQ